MSSPRPIDYASPHPPRRRVWLRWVVILVVVAVVCMLGYRLLRARALTVTLTATPAKLTAPVLPVPVVLASDPMVIDLQQRGGVQLPGGFSTPTLTIGDITGGQTIVTVQQHDGPTLLSKSMKEGDAVSFTYNSQTLHLKVVTLKNRLMGDDQATLHLSANLPISEAAKIEALIAHLEALEGATFIRNGDAHTAKDAAAHLRRKRDYAGDKITTAEQFIDELASKSSQSGEPYTIKQKDGTQVPAGDYLRMKLPVIEQQLRGGK